MAHTAMREGAGVRARVPKCAQLDPIGSSTWESEGTQHFFYRFVVRPWRPFQLIQIDFHKPGPQFAIEHLNFGRVTGANVYDSTPFSLTVELGPVPSNRDGAFLVEGTGTQNSDLEVTCFAESAPPPAPPHPSDCEDGKVRYNVTRQWSTGSSVEIWFGNWALGKVITLRFWGERNPLSLVYMGGAKPVTCDPNLDPSCNPVLREQARIQHSSSSSGAPSLGGKFDLHEATGTQTLFKDKYDFEQGRRLQQQIQLGQLAVFHPVNGRVDLKFAMDTVNSNEKPNVPLRAVERAELSEMRLGRAIGGGALGWPPAPPPPPPRASGASVVHALLRVVLMLGALGAGGYACLLRLRRRLRQRGRIAVPRDEGAGAKPSRKRPGKVESKGRSQSAGNERRKRATTEKRGGATRDVEAEDRLVDFAEDSDTEMEEEEEEEECRQGRARRTRPTAGTKAGGSSAKKSSMRPPAVQRDLAEHGAQCIRADADAEMLRVHEMIEAELASVAQQHPADRAVRPAKTKTKSKSNRK